VLAIPRTETNGRSGTRRVFLPLDLGYGPQVTDGKPRTLDLFANFEAGATTPSAPKPARSTAVKTAKEGPKAAAVPPTPVAPSIAHVASTPPPMTKSAEAAKTVLFTSAQPPPAAATALAAAADALPFFLDGEPDFDATQSRAEGTPKPASEPETLTVGAVGRLLKRSLDERFKAPLWVSGEVANLRAAPRGHVYLSLKDASEDAILDSVIYKTSLTDRMRQHIVEGAQLRVRGKPTFWAPRCRTQFVIDRVEPTGKGALLLALNQLKERLEKEGLFDPARKRPLPKDPRVIGIVTSATGAVIHDIRKVAFRRGGAHLLLAPAAVQGQDAAASMIRALALLSQVSDVDVIIIGRGGGSSDDLMAFNDEALVRAIAACRVPVVSAVGHEVDVSLTDFAADMRAATPSQAAEFVVVDRRLRREQLMAAQGKLRRAMSDQLTRDRLQLAELRNQLGDPRLLLSTFENSLDDLSGRLEGSQRRRLESGRRKLDGQKLRLLAQHPGKIVAGQKARLAQDTLKLKSFLSRSVAKRARTLGEAAAKLDSLSPLRVLGRGYSIVVGESGQSIRKVESVSANESIRILIEDGELDAKVTATRSASRDNARKSAP
jgi:exodeoxyribonuclease VII large subunit